jgi:hypothetical protein
MSDFSFYFTLGFRHILNLNGVDHILFIIALCTLYQIREWKKVLILITSFTIGHSITLALSTFNIVTIRSDLIEYLIPVTIFLTAASNVFKKQNTYQQNFQLNYFLASFFGMIHGMGFSYYLKSILGMESSVAGPLLSFNLGLEIGQIIIVMVFLVISWIFVNNFGISRRDWNMVISSGIAGVALTLMFESKYW